MGEMEILEIKLMSFPFFPLCVKERKKIIGGQKMDGRKKTDSDRNERKKKEYLEKG